MIVDLLVDGTTGLLALGTGYRWGTWRWQRRSGPDPICGCHHHLSMHSLESGQCRALVGRRDDTYNARGHYIGKQDRYCTCQQYVGPKPAEMVIAGGDQFSRADIAIFPEKK